jgi:tyrosine-specific transport protein
MKLRNKKFLATAFTLTGTIIGAGILGLPYVFSRAGFLAGLFWLVFLGAVMIYVNFYLGEVSLRTKDFHQLSGYAGKYLGKWGKRIMFFAVIFGIYSALLAYLVGEGQSFSQLFTGGFDYAILFGIGFWFLMTMLLTGGLKRLKSIEYWGVVFIMLVIFILVFVLLPDVKFNNLSYISVPQLFLPFGVVLFALLGFTSIPELRNEIRGDEKMLKKAIFVGALVPIVLYTLFALVFVGVLGMNVEQVATLSFGNLFGSLLIVLGIFTMLTSYFVLSFSLKDMFIYDFGKDKLVFLFVSLIPLLLYLVVSIFDLAGFVTVLGIGGVVSGGLTGVLILLMNRVAKKNGERKPEYSVRINWFIIGFLSLIFIVGALFEILKVI